MENRKTSDKVFELDASRQRKKRNFYEAQLSSCWGCPDAINIHEMPECVSTNQLSTLLGSYMVVTF